MPVHYEVPDHLSADPPSHLGNPWGNSLIALHFPSITVVSTDAETTEKAVLQVPLKCRVEHVTWTTLDGTGNGLTLVVGNIGAASNGDMVTATHSLFGATADTATGVAVSIAAPAEKYGYVSAVGSSQASKTLIEARRTLAATDHLVVAGSGGTSDVAGVNVVVYVRTL